MAQFNPEPILAPTNHPLVQVFSWKLVNEFEFKAIHATTAFPLVAAFPLA
jgi:hypothetical protein